LILGGPLKRRPNTVLAAATVARSIGRTFGMPWYPGWYLWYHGGTYGPTVVPYGGSRTEAMPPAVRRQSQRPAGEDPARDPVRPYGRTRILLIRAARMGGLADPSDPGPPVWADWRILRIRVRPYGRTLPKDPSYDRTASLRYLATYMHKRH